jgi:putative acetyltransferase
MSYSIRIATSEDYPKIMKIWESAVKSTHDFLSEADFEYFKKIIPIDYLPNLEVYLISENNDIKMLFIHNDSRGKGLGKVLCMFLKEKTGFSKVDVNEQNLQAIGFYEKLGFQKIGRSEKDGSGKDYPIIHMSSLMIP